MSSSKVAQLHLLQQNFDSLLTQSQQLESQLTEIDSAFSELQNTSQAYKIIGKIMLATSKDGLIKELKEKKEVTEVRLQNLKKQSETIQKNIDFAQKEVLEEMKKNSSKEKAK